MSTKCPCRSSLLQFILPISDHELCSTGTASSTLTALRSLQRSAKREAPLQLQEARTSTTVC